LISWGKKTRRRPLEVLTMRKMKSGGRPLLAGQRSNLLVAKRSRPSKTTECTRGREFDLRERGFGGGERRGDPQAKEK